MDCTRIRTMGRYQRSVPTRVSWGWFLRDRNPYQYRRVRILFRYRIYSCLFYSIYRDGTNEDHDTLIKLYRSVLALVPNFKKTIEGFGDDFESITELINLVRWALASVFLLTRRIDGSGIPECTTTRYIQDEGRHSGFFYPPLARPSRLTDPQR